MKVRAFAIDIAIAIAIFLLCLVLCLVVLATLTRIQPALSEWENSGRVCLIVATIMWVVIFFFCGLFTRMFKLVPDNQSWVIADYLKKEIVPTSRFTGKDRPIRAQRSIQSGPNFILPWEYVAPGGIVDMTKKSMGEIVDADSNTTKDRNQVVTDSEIFWAVCPGSEVNHFRFRQGGGDEDKISEFLGGRVKAFKQRYCIERDMDDIISHLDSLNQAFAEFLSEDRELHAMEEKIGAQITDGYFNNINPSKELEVIMEDRRKVKEIALAAKGIMADNTDFTAEQAWNYACIAADKQGIDVRHIQENFNITGLTPGLRSLIIGGGGQGGVSGGRGGAASRARNKGRASNQGGGKRQTKQNSKKQNPKQKPPKTT